MPCLHGYLVGSVALPSRAEAQSSYMSLAAASFLVIRSCKQKKILVLENIVPFPPGKGAKILMEEEKLN